ncbi:MAG: hypothetical protein E7398_00115 [Ruminococcaceae bacterium]|nr:hypothetical protein [Oscillospiraceae bacterium]
MKIKETIDLMCPSGFYCKKNTRHKCPRLNIQSDRPYCEVFYPFLETDSKGNVLKDERCLLAERKARLKE